MRRGEEYPQLILARNSLLRALRRIDRRRLEALANVSQAHDHLDAIVRHLDVVEQGDGGVDEYIAYYERLATNLSTGITLYNDDPRALACAAGLVLCEIEESFRGLARLARDSA